MKQQPLEYKPSFVPPGVELQARRFAAACSMMDWDYVNVTIRKGELSSISYGDGGKPTRTLYYIGGEWCEFVEVDDDGNTSSYQHRP